jgi:amidase
LGPAFHHNPNHSRIILDGEAVPYVDYCFPFVAIYNLTGMPVVTVPQWCAQAQLPVGLSFAAPRHHDQDLLRLSQMLESAGLTQPTRSLPKGLK